MQQRETSLPTGDLARDALRQALVGLGATSLLGLAFVQWLPVGAMTPAFAALTFGLFAAVAARWLRDHPYAQLGPANRITILRGVVIADLAALVVTAPAAAVSWPIVGLMVLALVLDGFDGWAARRYRVASAFGARLDQELDAVFMLVLSLLAYRSGQCGAWVLAAGLWRYVFLVLTKLSPAFRAELPYSPRRRAICPIVLGGLILSVTPGLPPLATIGFAVAAVLLLSASFLVDILWLWTCRPPQPGLLDHGPG